MYKIINSVPSKEQIENFKMHVSEEDAFINYKVDLGKLDDAQRKELIDTFALKANELEGKAYVTLSLATEV